MNALPQTGRGSRAACAAAHRFDASLWTGAVSVQNLMSGWSSPVARQAHNLEVARATRAPATISLETLAGARTGEAVRGGLPNANSRGGVSTPEEPARTPGGGRRAGFDWRCIANARAPHSHQRQVGGNAAPRETSLDPWPLCAAALISLAVAAETPCVSGLLAALRDGLLVEGILFAGLAGGIAQITAAALIVSARLPAKSPAKVPGRAVRFVGIRSLLRDANQGVTGAMGLCARNYGDRSRA